MKYKSLIAILFIIFSLDSYSQNWTLINPAYKYNYSSDSTGYPGTVTIFIDSSYIIGGDSVFDLNRIIIPLPYNIYFPWNLPQFLQRTMTLKANGDVLFYDTLSFLIKPQNDSGATWIFDSVNNITAQIINKSFVPVLGIDDSVKYILLSSLDTIIISKNYGIVAFSASIYHNKKYILTGIEGLNLGLKLPGFWDIFNINVGDVFEYHAVYDDTGYSPVFNDYLRETNCKFNITNKQVQPDTLLIEIDILKKQYEWWWFNNRDTTIYDHYITSIMILKQDFNFLELENNAPRYRYDFGSPMISKIYLYYDYLLQSPGKGSTGYWCIATVGNDLLSYCNAWYTPQEKYAVERGLTYYRTNSYSQQAPPGYRYDSTLVGCIINGITYGSISPDSFFTIGITDLENEYNFSLFPNPFADQLNLKTNSDKILEITIYDITSRELIRKEFSHTLNINTTSLLPGIYLYQVRDKNLVVKNGKLVKSH